MKESLVDVMLSMDESLDTGTLETLKECLLLLEGVAAASNHPKTPYLMLVQYKPDIILPEQLLESVKELGHHCELLGF